MEMRDTSRLLKALEAGELTREEVQELYLDHGGSAHSLYLDGHDAWQRERGERAARPQPSLEEYDAVLDRLLDGAPALADEVETERQHAERICAELLPASQDDRLSQVQADPDRFANPILVDLLLDEAKRYFPGDPRQSLSLSHLAQAIAWQLGPVPGRLAESHVNELRARAMAYGANATRILGDLKSADRELADARRVLEIGGFSDHRVTAELDWIEGILRRTQRRFDEAAELLDSTILQYEMIGETLEAMRCRLTRAELARIEGKPAEALAMMHQVLPVLEELDEQSILVARHNLALYLNELGRVEEAQQVLAHSLELYDCIEGPSAKLRLRWLQARLARSLGEGAEAERLLTGVQQGLLTLGQTYEAALAALELADIHLERGNTARVKELALEMLPVFEEQDVRTEALKALRTFYQAAAQEAVTREMVRRTIDRLDLAHYDEVSPGLWV